MGQPLSIAEVASHFGIATWKIHKLYEKSQVPAENVHRLGPVLFLYPHELPVIRACLERAGRNVNVPVAAGPAIGD